MIVKIVHGEVLRPIKQIPCHTALTIHDRIDTNKRAMEGRMEEWAGGKEGEGERERGEGWNKKNANV